MTTLQLRRLDLLTELRKAESMSRCYLSKPLTQQDHMARRWHLRRFERTKRFIDQLIKYTYE